MKQIPGSIQYYDDNKKYEAIRNHVEKIIENRKYQEVLRKILTKLFFIELENASKTGGFTQYSDSTNIYRANKRITHPDVFQKYFMLKVPVTELADITIENILQKWNIINKEEKLKQISADIKKYREEGYFTEFIDKIITFSQILDNITCKAITEHVYSNINLYSVEEGSSRWQSESRTNGITNDASRIRAHQQSGNTKYIT